MNSEEIERIETKIAFLESANVELSDVVYRQQQEMVQRKLFQEATFSDYIFEKSKLFAYLNLEDNELLIYEKLFALLSESERK